MPMRRAWWGARAAPWTRSRFWCPKLRTVLTHASKRGGVATGQWRNLLAKMSSNARSNHGRVEGFRIRDSSQGHCRALVVSGYLPDMVFVSILNMTNRHFANSLYKPAGWPDLSKREIATFELLKWPIFHEMANIRICNGRSLDMKWPIFGYEMANLCMRNGQLGIWNGQHGMWND